MKELSHFLLDIAENSIDAGASLIEITIDESLEKTVMTVCDNGCGMNENELKKSVAYGYSTKGANRGRGLAELKGAAEKSGGGFEVKSEKARGTEVKAEFYKKKSLPIGDINSTVKLLILCHPKVDVLFRRKFLEKELCLDTRQIKSAIGDVPIENLKVLRWIQDYLNEQTKIIFGGAVDEING